MAEYFKINSIDDFVGNKLTLKNIDNIIENINNNDILLIIGPSGIGKTKFVEIVCEKYNYNFTKIDSSICSNSKVLVDRLEKLHSWTDLSQLFCDNTILISTSVIETLGLHVIEGIKNGVVTIAPDEKYANTVYGKNMFKYELFNKDSLVRTIMSVVNYKKSYSKKILSIQDDLRQREISKFSSILDVFEEVLNIQK